MRIFSVLMVLFSMNAANAAPIQRPSDGDFQKVGALIQNHLKVSPNRQIVCFDKDGGDVVFVGGMFSSQPVFRALLNVGRRGYEVAFKNSEVVRMNTQGYYLTYDANIRGSGVGINFPSPISSTATPSKAEILLGGSTRTVFCFQNQP